MEKLNDLLNYTKNVFQANNITESLDNVNDFGGLKTVLDKVWGWDSDNTIYLFEGYYRRSERENNKIITSK
jgi:hypothetical protein